MNKKEFDNLLDLKLKNIPYMEAKKIKEYYQELFNDKLEHGISEDEIIKSFGEPVSSLDDLEIKNNEVKIEAVEKNNTETKIKAKRSTIKKPSLGLIILLIIFFPVIIGLIGAFFGISIAIFFTILSIIIAGIAIFFSLVITGITLVPSGIFMAIRGSVFLFTGYSSQGLVLMGSGIILVALGLLLILNIKPIIKLIKLFFAFIIKTCNSILIGLKNLFTKRNKGV